MNPNSCPRCGERTLERFQTHSYCANCNYSNVMKSWEWDGREVADRVGGKRVEEDMIFEVAFTPQSA